jgi:peptide/nickel transport system permease protein
MLVMGVVDLQLAFPFVLLAISIIAVVGTSLTTLIVVLALSGWVIYARTVRGIVLSLREKEFVEAERALGANDLRIMARHVLPNVISPTLVIASVEISKMILLEGTISFLGLGVQPPTPSWGNMIGEGRDYVTMAWWIAFFPGLAMMLTVLGVNFFADGLRGHLDPQN